MTIESLTILKKELALRSDKELREICVRLAKLKKENKEMLAYLLYESEDPLAYAEKVKEEIDVFFEDLSSYQRFVLKQIRKGHRLIPKYVRFAASKQGELELQLHFIRKFTQKVESGLSFTPLQQVLFRSIVKAQQLIGKLHEDLQYDYKDEFNRAASDVLSTFHRWDRNKFKIELIKD